MRGCARNVVEAVHRAARVAMEPSAVAGEGYEVRRRAVSGPLGRCAIRHKSLFSIASSCSPERPRSPERK